MRGEQVIDPRPQPPAERQPADAPVAGHRPAGAQPDDMALAVPLLAVLGRDDPRVVAERAQLVVCMPDVLVDPARVGNPYGLTMPIFSGGAARLG